MTAKHYRILDKNNEFSNMRMKSTMYLRNELNRLPKNERKSPLKQSKRYEKQVSRYPPYK